MTDERINAMFAVALDLLNANLAMAAALMCSMSAAACDSRKERGMAELHRDRRIRWANEYAAHARQIAREVGLIPPEGEDE